MQIGTFFLILFCLPETLYPRPVPEHKERSFADSLMFKTVSPDRKLDISDIWKPLLMLRHARIAVPALYYMTAFAYGSVLFAATGAQLFREYYDFNLGQTGLLLSVPLLIGCLLGEMSTGWFTDWLVFQDAKHHDGERRPEARIRALWLGLLLPIGTIVEGVSLSHRKTVSWVGSALGMALASYGLQAATTVTYTYCTDVSSTQSRVDLL